MSPFRSKAQERAAFGGYLGPEMKSRAKAWASETPNQKSLPSHVKQASHPAKNLGAHLHKSKRG